MNTSRQTQPLLSATLSVFSQQLLGALAHIANTVLITNVFGAEGFGTYIIIILLATLLSTVFSAGLPTANIYFVNARGMPARKAWNTSCALSLVLILIGESAGLTTLYVWKDFFFENDKGSYWLLVALLFPAQLLLGLSLGLLQAKQHFSAFNRVSLLQPCSLFLATALIILAGIREIEAIAIGHTLCVLLTLTVSIHYVYRHAFDSSRVQSSQEVSWQSLLAFGLRAHLSNVATLMNYKLDSLLINGLIGHTAVGIYNVAIQISERLWMLSQAASIITLPRSAIAQKDDQVYLGTLTATCRWVMAITLLGGAVISLLGYYLIPLVFGQAFSTAWGALNILVAGTTALAFSRILANDIAAKGKPELNLYSSLAVLVVNAALNLTLIPSLGIYGAALATSIAYIVSSGLIVHFHRRHIAQYRFSELLLSREDINIAITYLKQRRQA